MRLASLLVLARSVSFNTSKFKGKSRMRPTYAQPLLVPAVDRKNIQMVRIDNDHERQVSHRTVQKTPGFFASPDTEYD